MASELDPSSFLAPYHVQLGFRASLSVHGISPSTSSASIRRFPTQRSSIYLPQTPRRIDDDLKPVLHLCRVLPSSSPTHQHRPSISQSRHPTTEARRYEKNVTFGMDLSCPTSAQGVHLPSWQHTHPSRGDGWRTRQHPASWTRVVSKPALKVLRSQTIWFRMKFISSTRVFYMRALHPSHVTKI